MQAYAAAFADRLLGSAEVSTQQAVQRGYQIALSRPADDAELSDSADFIDRGTELYRTASHENPRRQAVADFCQVLFGLNEFIYVD